MSNFIGYADKQYPCTACGNTIQLEERYAAIDEGVDGYRYLCWLCFEQSADWEHLHGKGQIGENT